MAGLVLFWLLVGGGLGYAIGQSKGRGPTGFWLGLLLGVIGWVIVAVMEPTDEVRRKRNAEVVALGGFAPPAEVPTRSDTRSCPYCAEIIKRRAILCRFCGRDIEPDSDGGLDGYVEDTPGAALHRVRSAFPLEYEQAAWELTGLPTAPENPAAWTAELCKRIAAGSPPDRAAARIPLDWRGEEPAIARSINTAPVADPDYAVIQLAHPDVFDEARRWLDARPERPDRPGEWLAELCKRIEAGSPPALAADRIPTDWISRN